MPVMHRWWVVHHRMTQRPSSGQKMSILVFLCCQHVKHPGLLTKIQIVSMVVHLGPARRVEDFWRAFASRHSQPLSQHDWQFSKGAVFFCNVAGPHDAVRLLKPLEMDQRQVAGRVELYAPISLMYDLQIYFIEANKTINRVLNLEFWSNVIHIKEPSLMEALIRFQSGVGGLLRLSVKCLIQPENRLHDTIH